MMELLATIKEKGEKTLSKITTTGQDLAKNVFHVVCCDARRKLIGKKQLRRSHLLSYFAQLPACRVGMEACAGAFTGAASCRRWDTRLH